MEILIIDPDPGYHAPLKQALRENFQNLDVRFEENPETAAKLAEHKRPDLAIIECSLPGVETFSFLRIFLEREIPFILMADHPPARLIVEGMRAGALDFILKNKFDSALFVSVVKRVLLEADRWQKIRHFASQLEPREMLQQVDQELKSLISLEVSDAAAAGIRRKTEPEEGNTYLMTFLNIQLYLPQRFAGKTDALSIDQIRTRVMNNLARLESGMDGIQWSRHEDNLIFAFINEPASRCLHCAFKAYGYLNTLKFSLQGFENKPSAAICMAASSAIYRENKSELYSEALNLSAHLAMDPNNREKFLLAADFYDLLHPREKRYFTLAPPREDYKLYEFHYLTGEGENQNEEYEDDAHAETPPGDRPAAERDPGA